MAKGGRKSDNRSSVSHRRGSAAGSKRGTPDIQVRRRVSRQGTARVQDAQAKAAADRAWLEAEDAKVQAIVAEWTAEIAAKRAAAEAAGQPAPPVPALHDLTNRTAGDLTRWTVGQARLLLEDGYSLERVCQRTGWGGWWFRDLAREGGYLHRVSTFGQEA